MSVGQSSKKSRATFAVRQTALSPTREFSDVSIFQFDYSTGNEGAADVAADHIPLPYNIRCLLVLW